jgi:hypothetical protein
MGLFISIMLSSLLGIFGHWLVKWSKETTSSNFKEYLLQYKANTIQSVSANLISIFTIYSSVPDDIGGRALIMVLIGAFTAGYAFDSGFNKDQTTDVIKAMVKTMKNE